MQISVENYVKNQIPGGCRDSYPLWQGKFEFKPGFSVMAGMFVKAVR
jgi:hypothetical protein